jgi:hypothetical protein
VRVKTGQASLARSIEQHGLLHPVVIPRDGVLIAGERRLESYKLLGRTDNPRRRLLPPSGVAPCGSSIRPPVLRLMGRNHLSHRDRLSARRLRRCRAISDPRKPPRPPLRVTRWHRRPPRAYETTLDNGDFLRKVMSRSGLRRERWDLQAESVTRPSSGWPLHRTSSPRSSHVRQPQAPQRCPAGIACACFTLPSRVWATLPFPLSAAGRLGRARRPTRSWEMEGDLRWPVG